MNALILQERHRQGPLQPQAEGLALMLQERLQNQAGPSTRLLPLRSVQNQQHQPTIVAAPAAGLVQNQQHHPTIVTAPAAGSSMLNEQNQPTIVTAPAAGSSVQNQQNQPTTVTTPTPKGIPSLLDIKVLQPPQY